MGTVNYCNILCEDMRLIALNLLLGKLLCIITPFSSPVRTAETKLKALSGDSEGVFYLAIWIDLSFTLISLKKISKLRQDVKVKYEYLILHGRNHHIK